jgi:sulfur relay (sulfurtransferase) DsrF/TusC family protein
LSRDEQRPLGLVVRQGPYSERSARAQLDVALAAAALELPLEIFFIGEGIWQLAAARDSTAALLPRGLKGWAALPDMTSVRYFALEDSCSGRVDPRVDAGVHLESLDGNAMAARWRACSQVMAL